MNIVSKTAGTAWTTSGECVGADVDTGWVHDRLGHHLRDLTTRIEDEPTPLHPIFIPPRSYDDLLGGTLAVLRAARRMVDRLVETGVPAAAEALGVDASYVRLMAGSGDVERAAMGAMARPDVIPAEDGPKVIELNVGGSFGGVVEHACLVRAWKEVFPRADWDAMSPVDPVEQRARFLDAAFRASGASDLYMIGELADHARSSTLRYYDLELAALRARGLPVKLIGAREVGRISRRRLATSALAFANFSPAEWQGREGRLNEIERFVHAGGRLLPSMLSTLMNSKAVLAYLSAEAEGAPDSAASVARYVPWTRIVSGERGEASISVDDVLRHRDSLVLKKSLSLRSADVVVGRYRSPADWRSVAERAARGGWVAQRRVEPVVMSTCVAERETGLPVTCGMRCVMGPIVIGGETHAVYGRYHLGEPAAGIINAASAGAMENIVVPGGRRLDATVP